MPPTVAAKNGHLAAHSAGTLIPDCCNIGVVFRVLAGVNAVALMGVLIHASGWKQGVQAFIEISVVIESACLWSLFLLCGVRRMLQRVQSPLPVSPWAERAACVAVPAAVAGSLVHFFAQSDWLLNGFAHMTTWKAAATAALLGMVFQHYFELRTRAYSPALVEARLQALQARIRPHFLFNSLNAVLSLIRDEPRRAETTLEDLADLFRVLMSDPRSMSTLAEEIRLCRQYLSIEKIRLGDRLQVQWIAEHVSDSMLRKAQVPVLLLQPLLENAVHYGVEPASGPALVQVHLKRSLDRIEIVVVNRVHPQTDGTKGNHMALNNIRERLALLYDVEAQLTTTMTQGFYEVRLRFPYVRGRA